MPKYERQLAALEILLDDDRCLPEILRSLETDELAQLGEAAQALAEHCETAWFTRLAAESGPWRDLLDRIAAE
jgi:hypothetical protein